MANKKILPPIFPRSVVLSAHPRDQDAVRSEQSRTDEKPKSGSRPPRVRARPTPRIPDGSPIVQRAFAPDWSRILLLIATIAALSALLSLHLLPDKVSVRAGEVSSREIRAQRTVRYPDQETTKVLRDAAAARVTPIYDAKGYALPEADQTISEIYAHLRRARIPANLNPQRAALELRQEVGIVISPPSLLKPLLSDATGAYHLDQAERLSHRIIHEVMSREIRDVPPGDMAQARATVTRRIATSLLPRASIPAVAALARATVRPNRLFNREATETVRAAQRGLVAPQYAEMFAGDIVVRRGEPVTPEIIDKLRALSLQNPRLDPGMITGIALLVALMVGVIVVYLARYQRALYASTRMLALLSLLVLLGIFGWKLGGTLLGVRLSGAQFGYVGMLSVAAVGMLISALINTRIALVVAALLAAQSGLILGNDVRFAVMTLLSSFVAIYAVSDLRSRGDVLRAVVALCAANIVLSFVLSRIEGDPWSELSQSLLWSVVSGALAVAIFGLAAPLFERLFGITTHLGLLELSDPNRPLLQLFSQLAPGTYIHSVMVSNLAVAAAEAIGADALLCRVGAYYHDLGKMGNAEYFVENQGGRDNVHNKLNPSLSALVVTAHVKKGLEIAGQEKLPQVIKAFITEHHGTSLIRYFYHQQTAGAVGEATPGLEQCFRYGGPKPQSRETAIVMLADSVEAASRTLDKPTAGRIEDLVEQIIHAQLGDGQLDECDLTLRDLRGIRDAFVRLLTGMLHTRIDYPDAAKSTEQKPEELKPESHEPADLPENGAVSHARCAKDGHAPAANRAAA